MEPTRLDLISDLRKINLHLFRAPRRGLSELGQDKHGVSLNTSHQLRLLEFSGFLQDRILSPVTHRNFVQLFLNICEACGCDARLEGVDCVDWFSSRGAATNEERTPFREEGVCRETAVVGKEARPRSASGHMDIQSKIT